MNPRHILEKILRPLTVRRNLPTNFGNTPIIASAQAGLAYIFRPIHQIDPSLLFLVDHLVKPDSVVWDVGANIGLFAIASAYKATSSGHVIAIEPDVYLVRLLRESVRLQPVTSAPITVLPVGIASDFGFRTFAIAERARANNHLAEYPGSTQTGGTRHLETIVTLTLDQLLNWYPAPNFSKN